MTKEEKKEETTEEEVSSLPGDFKEEEGVVSKVSSLKEKIKNTLSQLKDLSTLEIMMPVSARLEERLKSIKERYSAKHIKIRRDGSDKGHWKTIKPELHIRGLRGRKLDNKIAEITFEVYEMDEKGDKKLYSKKTKVQLSDGRVEEREVTADYRIAQEVIETIKYGKPITREIVEMDTEGIKDE